jgi:hypothetical protein
MPTRRAFNTGLLAMLGSTALAGCATNSARESTARITGIDTHAHVFERGLPLANARRYAPGYDAPLSAYLAQLDAHGLSNGVLIQPSFLGTDNSYLLAWPSSTRPRPKPCSRRWAPRASSASA